MNNLTTIYVVRHGTTEYNEKHIIQGLSDSPLTENGKKGIQELSKKLKDVKFDYIYSSDLGRTMQTAEILALEHNLAIQANKLLRERNFGELDGKPSENFQPYLDAIKLLKTNTEKINYKHSSEIESNEEVVTRFFTFLKEAAILEPGKILLVVTHGGVIRSILTRTGYASYDQVVHGKILNGAYLVLETDGTVLEIKKTEGVILN